MMWYEFKSLVLLFFNYHKIFIIIRKIKLGMLLSHTFSTACFSYCRAVYPI